FKVMRPGTLIFTCNCSSAMTKERFAQLIDQSGKQNHRELRLLGNFGPSLDHPTLEHFPEGSYLHALMAVVF
nr:class I SAM-dependent rRNA methyltransferase [Pseudomonadota bacterium]